MPELMSADPIVREDLARLRAQNESQAAKIKTLEARIDNLEKMLGLLGQPVNAAPRLDRELSFR